ncbi:MAG: DUF2007 domain-containing protein [Bacteroidales bacterium]
MEKLIEITAFNNVNDAYILRTLLESENISCYLQDENSATIMNGYANIGGVKVMISSNDYERAATLMKDHGYDVDGVEGDVPANEVTNPPVRKGLSPGMRLLVWALLIIVVVLLYFLWKSYSITDY